MSDEEDTAQGARYGVLDDRLRLVGYISLPADEEAVPDNYVEVPQDCDLPGDGSFKWSPAQDAFFPLGHGFDRPQTAPVALERVVYLLGQQLGRGVPAEVTEWMEWYETNLRARHEEQQTFKRIRNEG